MFIFLKSITDTILGFLVFKNIWFKNVGKKIFSAFFLKKLMREGVTPKRCVSKVWVGPPMVKRRRGDFMGWEGVKGICECGS